MKKEWKERNIRLLQEMLKEKGFPASVMRELGEKVRAGKESSFTLHFATKIEGDLVRGNLVFRNTLTISGYQLDSFALDLSADRRAILKTHVFKPTPGYDVGLEEAYNLMHGRYVYKAGSWLAIGSQDGHSYVTWLDNQSQPFRVEREFKACTLGLYLNKDQQVELAGSLKQGNLHELELLVVGMPQTIWVMANPLEGRIDLFEGKGDWICLRKPNGKLTFGVAKGAGIKKRAS